MKYSLSSRPTLGFLLSRMAESFQTQVWQGITDAAEKMDVNLMCIAGRSLRAPFSHDKIHNNLFKLVQRDNIDGILLMSGCISNFISIEEYDRFLEPYEGIPQVSISLDPDGIPSVLSDNSTGLREAIFHLYQLHGFRRIAMIKGPEKHREAETRFATYCKTLEELGIEYDPRLVAPGDFTLASVPHAISILLDERKAEFDALVVVNDEMAVAATDILQQRGYHIPDMISVVGFDNTDGAISTVPPLTTVHQPLYELGYKGMEILIAQLNGETVAQRTILPTHLVIRRSCGCYSQTIREVQQPPKAASDWQNLSPEFRSKVTRELNDKFQPEEALLGVETISRLVHAIFDDIKYLTATFLRELSYAIRSWERSSVWHAFLSELHLRVLPYLEPESIIIMESLLQKARILLGEAANEAEIRDRLRIESQSIALSEISHGLMTVLDFEKLREALAEALPSLGIPRCYLVLFSGIGDPPKESRLIVACGSDLCTIKETNFLTRQWLPKEFWAEKQRVAYVVEALHFRDEMLGYVIFEMGPRQGAVYEALAGQLSTAVKGALLYEERNRSEAAFRESQRVLSTMMSNLPGMAYRCRNNRDWSMEFISEGCHPLTGYSMPALLNNKPTYAQIIHPEDFQFTSAIIREALANNRPFQITYRIITASGENRWVWEQGRGVQDERGETVAFEGFIMDVTERRRAEEELTYSLDKLRHSVESTIMAMALTVEIRDPYTSGHQRRVAQLAFAIAREMGLDEEQCNRIRLAAGIHDLGKIHIPAEILSKPGKITPIEYRLIQTHPEVGRDILQTMDIPWPIERIVLQHHERLDGSGYPHKLKGDEILQEARILSVADVVEAMSSHRPYRPALGIEQALQEIQMHSGGLYDEQVVDVCLRLFNHQGFIFETVS